MSSEEKRKIFADNLVYYMNKTNTSRNDLCKALNLKYTTVRDWTKGLSYPRVDKISQLANYFGIDEVMLTQRQVDIKRLVKSMTDAITNTQIRLGLDKVEEIFRSPKLDVLMQESKSLSDKELDYIINVVRALKEYKKSITP